MPPKKGPGVKKKGRLRSGGNSKGDATGLSEVSDGSNVGPKAKTGSHKKPRVSAAAVKTHPVKKISLDENSQRRTRSKTSTEPYKERVVSGKALSKWRVMPTTSQEHIIKVLDGVISSVLHDTKGAAYKDVQIHLNQLKERITKSLKSLNVPPVRDYNKLEEQCKTLEEILVETNNRSESLDAEIDEIEKMIEEKEEHLEELEKQSSDGENNNDRCLHPTLEATYTNQLGLPPLSNPACYFGGIKDAADDLQSELLQSLSAMQTSNNSQEISQYIATLLNQVGSLP